MNRKLLKTSVKMATVMGLFLPLAETVRRSNQLSDLTRFFYWFDDYMLGGVLLIAVYLVKRRTNNAISFLIAAWGFTAGALFLSFLSQFGCYITNKARSRCVFYKLCYYSKRFNLSLYFNWSLFGY